MLLIRQKELVLRHSTVCMKVKRLVLVLLLVASCSIYAQTKNKNRLADSLPVKSKKYTSSLLAFGQLSTYTQAIGLKYCGGMRLKNHPLVRLGPSLFWERIEFNGNIKLPRNLVKGQLVLITPGLNIETRLRPIIDLNFGISAVIGSETIEKFIPSKAVTTVETKTIGGAHFDQALFVKTAETGGLKLGIGIFERLLGGTFYEEDFGGRLYLGIEF